MECKWEEAAGVNREIIEFSPDDLDAWNRLGKALLELGDAKGSRAAFEHTLTIDPSNTIARKNIERLSLGSYASSIGGAQADRRMFNGDSGKSAQVALMGVTAGKGRLYLAPGGAIDLRPNNGNLTVFSSDGRFVGIVPPQLGRRLVLLMEAGNRYDGAIASTTADAVAKATSTRRSAPRYRSHRRRLQPHSNPCKRHRYHRWTSASSMMMMRTYWKRQASGWACCSAMANLTK